MQSLSLYFSPTGGGEKIANAIQSGMDHHDGDYMFNLNLNKKSLSQESGHIEKMPVILTIPVYGGHMPKTAAERFDKAHSSNNDPAIIVAVYGNRAFENALTDLEAFVRERGFNPVAAAAFPCEHSYSNSETPIAAGRPDDTDLKAAGEFGRLVREKILRHDFTTINASDLKDEPSPESSVRNFISFVKNYQAEQAASPRKYLPILDPDKCPQCGKCVEICPVNAIRSDLSTDPSLCIKCCACVKNCPSGARTFQSPFAVPLSENFQTRKSPHWIL